MPELSNLDWRSALLGLSLVQIAVIAVSVLQRRDAGPAGRWFAGFLAVLAGVLTPYAIGYSGAYDRWPALTFLPVAMPLALGPTLYGYVYGRATGRPLPRPGLHLAPPGIHFLYSSAAFLLPPTSKRAWFVGDHSLMVAPLVDVAALISLAVYAVVIGRTVVANEADLRADEIRWLRRVLVAFGAVLAVKSGFDLWSITIAPPGYDAQTWMYLAFAAAGLFLAVEGWRRTGEEARARRAARNGGASGAPAAGVEYAERIRIEGWWREPDIDVSTLARRLGTSESSLSRAFSAGLGVGVARYVNDLRADAVAEALRAGARDDLLRLALENGFSSKSKFNRVFQARFGRTPSAYRQEVADPGFSDV